MLKINFASLVRQKEEAMGLDGRLTQKELAEALGVTPHTVGKWMRGQVSQLSIEQLETFINYFDCSIEDLLVEQRMPDPN